MENRELLLQRLQDAREKMRQVVQRADMLREIYPHWRMKQIIDHLTGWDDATLVSFRHHLEHGVPYTPATRGIDDYNARTVTERETLDLAHSLQEWEVTRAQLIELIRSAPQDMYETPFIFPWGNAGTIEQLALIFIEHEEDHAKEISEILDRG